MSRHSRRQFLSTSAAAAGALALGAYVNPTPARASRLVAERLRIAGVGTTGRAGANLSELSSQDIVALADVDDNLMEKGAAKFPAAHSGYTLNAWVNAENDNGQKNNTAATAQPTLWGGNAGGGAAGCGVVGVVGSDFLT